MIDTVAPIVAISAPTKLDNASIGDTTIVVTDETGVSSSDVSVS